MPFLDKNHFILQENPLCIIHFWNQLIKTVQMTPILPRKNFLKKIISQGGPCGLAGVHFDLFGPAGRVKSHFQAKKSYGHCFLHSSNELRLCSALNFKLCQKTGRPTPECPIWVWGIDYVVFYSSRANRIGFRCQNGCQEAAIPLKEAPLDN